MPLGLRTLASVCLLVLAVPVAAQTAPGAAQMAQQVGVATMARTAVPLVYELPGRAVAYQQVAVRPRVGGVITEILYTPGQRLEAGTPLLRIDDASYRANLASAEADLLKAQAALPVAQNNYDRAVKLKGSGYTAAEVESYQATLAEAKATLDAAEAARDYARTELSWTTVTTPITGFAEVADVSVGDLVTAGQSDALTTVTRLDPIDVIMLEASARVLEIRKQLRDGTISRNKELKVTLTLENGETYVGKGEIVAPSATVSTTTGSIDIRFRFDNPGGEILPGMFVRGQVELGTINVFLVPQRATSRDSTGALKAFVVAADGTAKQVTLTAQGSYRNGWIVTDGLTEGDRLILDGLKTLQAGQAVSPVAAQVDATGLVVDDPADGAAPADRAAE